MFCLKHWLGPLEKGGRAGIALSFLSTIRFEIVAE